MKKNGLIYFSLIGLIASLYINYYDIQLWKIIANKTYTYEGITSLFIKSQAIGVIIEANGDIQRKKESDINYQLIKKNDLIYFKDYIITSNNGIAKIKLSNNDIITISPNTLIKIEISPKESFLSFKQFKKITLISGNIDSHPNRNNNADSLEIVKKPFIAYKVKKENNVIPAEMLKEKPKNYEEIQKEIPSITFKPKEVEQKRELASVEKIDPQPIVKPIEIKNLNLHYVVKNANNNTNEIKNEVFKNLEIDFYWDEEDELKDGYNMLYIYDPQNHQLLNKIKTNFNHYSYKDIIIPNSSIVKIKKFNSQNELIGQSKSKIFEFDFNPPVLDSNPIDLNLAENDNLLLTWKFTNFTDHYEVQLIDLNDKIIFSAKTKNNYVLIKNENGIHEGLYKYRIKSINNNFESEWSNTRIISLTNKDTELSRILFNKGLIKK